MELRVINFRKYDGGGLTLGFFDLSIADTFVVRGFALKKKRDEDKYYFQSPSKPRQKKVLVAGETYFQNVKGDDGYDKYDAAFDLYGERTDDGYKPTKAAFEGRQTVIDLAMAAAGLGGGGGSTASAPKREEVGTTDAEEDDDLPF
jgi:hypothetical protein